MSSNYWFEFILEQAEEREAQALMQRIVAWAEDNMLFVGGGYSEAPEPAEEAEDGDTRECH